MNEPNRQLYRMVKALHLGLPSLMNGLKDGSLPVETQDEFGALLIEIGSDLQYRSGGRTDSSLEVTQHG